MLCSLFNQEVLENETDSFASLVDDLLGKLRHGLLEHHSHQCLSLMQTNAKLQKTLEALRGPEKKLPPKDIEHMSSSPRILPENQQTDVGNYSQGLQLASIEKWGSGPRVEIRANVQQPMDDLAPDFEGLEVQVGAVDDAEMSLDISNWARLLSRLLKIGRNVAQAEEQEELEMRLCWQRLAVIPESKRQSDVSRISSLTDIDDIVSRLSYKNRCLRFLDSSIVSRFVMAPQSFGRLAWMMFGFLSIAWDIIMSPVALFDLPESMVAAYQTVGFISFVYWVIDFGIQFLTGVVVGTTTDMRPSVILKTYLKSWFVPDVVMLSTDVLILVVGSVSRGDSMQESYKGLRAFRALRMLRLMRLLKMGTFLEYLTMLRERYVPEGLLLLVTLVKIWGAFFLVNHYVACAWYALGLSNLQNSWLVDADLQNSSFGVCYGNSLHWSLTQFTPATNNINPNSPEERAFAILVIFLATGCFSSFVGAITTAVNQMRANEAQRNEQENYLRTFFRERGLSVFLFMVVQNFFKRKKLYKRFIAESQVQILQEIPESLRMVLREEMYKPQLSCVRWLPDSCDPGVMGKICVKAFSERCADPSQDIFLPGTPCDMAYVFSSGSLTYSRHSVVHVDLVGSANYVEAKTFNASHRQPVWVAQPALWTKWKYRGQLTANDSCVYSCVDGMLLALTTNRHDPSVYQFIRTYGLLLLTCIDSKDSRSGSGSEHVTDMDLPDEDIQTIVDRANKFIKKSNSKRSIVRKLRISERFH